MSRIQYNKGTMKVVGGDFNEESARAVRTISVIITPILALYALLVLIGVVSSIHYVNAPITIGISLLWVLMSLFHFVRPVSSLEDQAVRIVTIHFFALMMFIFVIGFSQPLAPLYVLLILASNLYFGKKGLLLSIGALVLSAAFDVLLRYQLHPELVAQNGLIVFSIIFLGVSIIGILSAQETKRQALIHSQRRERLQYDRILTIMNNLTDAAFSTDENGKILLYNAACLDLLDTNDSLKGKNIGTLFTLTNSDGEAVNLFDVLTEATKATRRDDLTHTYSADDSVRLEITFAPIRSSYSLSKRRDKQSGYILIMRDVTKQKSLEEERDEFISVVSHELRTPITIVEGTLSNLDVMMHQPTQPAQSVLASTVETAHNQTIYLAKMVNDLSTLSRAERGIADTPEEIDVKDLLQTMHHQYENEASLKGLRLDIDLGARLGKVNVSRLYLEELLQNFITNAIKYTKEGSVTVIGKRTKDTVTLAVKDTGIGMSRTDQAKIFNKFYRSEDFRIRETSGTGLGLYVSAKLARKLNTKISLTSRINHGSTFSFELPVE